MATFSGIAMITRALLAARAGLQFQGARDLYQVFGYPRVITPEMLYDKYKRQDVASTVIDKPAEALWTSPPKVTYSPEGTPPEEVVDLLAPFNNTYHLWSQVLRADKLLGMEPYVLLYLGLPGEANKQVTGAGKNTKLSFIQVFGGSCTQIKQYDADPSSPRFGHPMMYSLKVQQADGRVQVSKDVHYTRVIHLTNELLDSNILSEPRMVKGFNVLEDIMKIAGGSAETFWLTSNRGMQVDVDKEMEVSPGDLEALSDEIDEYQHQLRRVLRTRGVKVNSLGADTVDPRGAFTTSLSVLSATYKIPQRILMGAEAGQLASEQDRANWAISVQERRASFAEPHVIRPIVSRLQQLGIVDTSNDPLRIEWPEAFKLSPLEKAQTMAQTARAVVNLSRQTQLGNPLLTTGECRKVVGFTENTTLPSVEQSMEWQMTKSQPQEDPETEDEEDDDQNKQGNQGNQGNNRE